MQYFDTHAHIGLIYDDPIEQLLVCQEAKQAGVSKIVSICNSLMDFKQVYENLKTMEHIFHAVGVSPSEVQNPGKEWHRTIEDAVKLPRVMAIGEIGLDYYHRFGDRKSQIELFKSLDDFRERLRMPIEPDSIAVLSASDRGMLQQMQRLRGLLTEIFVVLVIPDRKGSTIRLAHLLLPRFLSQKDDDFIDLAKVLAKIYRTTH